MALTPTYDRTPHLVGLVAEVERLAAVLRVAVPDDDVADRLRDDAVVASLRLDGSTIPAPPRDEDLELAEAADGDDVPEAARGSWADAIRTRSDLAVEDTSVWALEFVGCRAALAADDLVEGLRDDAVPALAELNRRLVRGLVAPGVAGRPRRTEQAVHDASVGRVLYYPTPPDQVSRETALLGSWLAGEGGREHPLIVSGVAHEALLRIHPFEAANGRLARAAARLLLRHGDLDPHRLAVAELAMAEDPLGTYQEVARTRHRRDLTVWLERWGESVSAGLRLAARGLGLLAPDVPGDAEEFVRSRPTFTIADYRTALGTTTAGARDGLEVLLDAGLVTRQPATRGLRWTSAVG